MKPLLAVTSGDPGGVGPELAVAVLNSRAVRRAARLLLIGPRSVFLRAGWRPSLAPILDSGFPCRRIVRKPTAEGGRSSYEAVQLALKLAMRGLVDGVVTAPVSKEAWRLAGAPDLDHTSLIGRFTGAKNVGMMLAAGALKAVLVTRHIPLKQVAAKASARALEDAAVAACAALKGPLGVRRPKIGLCALNPHAGDGGLIGDEEDRRLRPAVRRLKRRGIFLEGPIPADAAWAAHAGGRYDALLAMYHDQALVPLKLAAGYRVVNWTIGVPLVRTSPGHGTAFDIAGKGKVDPSGMKEAILFAVRLCRSFPASRNGSRASRTR